MLVRVNCQLRIAEEETLHEEFSRSGRPADMSAGGWSGLFSDKGSRPSPLQEAAPYGLGLELAERGGS